MSFRDIQRLQARSSAQPETQEESASSATDGSVFHSHIRCRGKSSRQAKKKQNMPLVRNECFNASRIHRGQNLDELAAMASQAAAMGDARYGSTISRLKRFSRNSKKR